ncbi:carotenoid oxygenase family protein [Aureimonas leprariae]|uniref:Dioxygenase n=1 Tax=Plantimonas leprariae TaxID=2615207 RepID=A0A7V7PP08_9HYPH|nr:carotenoid oxygenase family protein [Aureimonas leprariae]KAB0679609.1 carotenoid oxygenase family protein [Aureimonas leprariae]
MPAADLVETAVRALASRAVSGIAAFNRWRLPARTTPHPLLTGIHAPMRDELTLTDLAVEGTIPPELDGRYLRMGPNPIAADPRIYHWFIGDGMVHGVRLRRGRAEWYRNRWIRSTPVAKATGIPAAPGPRFGGFDTVNTNVVGHAGAAWALVEAGSTPVRLGETLEDQRYDDFAGTLGGSFTAHPHYDPVTRELHAVCYQATDPNRVRHVVVGDDGRVSRRVEIPVKDGPLIHDCALTERFVIVFDLPLTISMKVVMDGYGFPYAWNPDHPARLGLLPRHGTAADVIWIDVDPCFIFHAANAFDLPDGRLVLDAVVYDRMFVSGEEIGPDEAARGFERWTVDPVRRTVERRTLDPKPQEFPRLDERRIGRPYRYAYALALPERFDPALVGAAPILKHDLETGERLEHHFGEGRIPGEFVFVPRAPDSAEDEGWMIGLVINPASETSALEIIDARAFAAPPVAVVRLPHRIPPGFHGNWVPERQAGSNGAGY